MKDEGAEVDLLDRIAADEAFGLSAGELAALVDPARFVGRAPQQVEAFLAREVQPVLDRYLEAARQIQPPEIHV